MRELSDFTAATITSGGAATLATTLAAACCAEPEGQAPAAPINAVRHIRRGDSAAHVDGFTVTQLQPRGHGGHRR